MKLQNKPELNPSGKLTLGYRAGLPSAPELQQLRNLVSEGVKRFPRHADVRVAYQEHDGIRCLIVTPETARVTLLYFHGGGFRIGSPELSAGFVSCLAAQSQCRVILPFYSLAPEHPFPAALLDGQRVLETLPTDQPLLIGGDSAGGNLAAVLARRFSEKLTGILLLSPWLDLRLTSTSYVDHAQEDKVFSLQAASSAASLYLQGHDAHDPDVSPVLGNLLGMPPALIMVGSKEVLLQDSLTYTRQLQAAGAQVDLHVIPDMAHVEPTVKPAGANTAAALSLASTFIKRFL